MSSLSATLLGTGNPLPDPSRAGASTLVSAGPRRFLVDAGRAVCMRLAAAGVLPIMLDGVLLTHLHSDHICALNDVITTHWIMSQHAETLHILGPRGTRAVVDGALAMLGSDISYRLAHHADLTWGPQVEVRELGPGVAIADATLKVTAAATEHQPVEPSLVYRFDHDGRSIVVAGDTVPCSDLDTLCSGADVYIQTVLREDLVELVPMQRFRDTITYHSTVEQAARTASRCRAATLVLTHQIPTPAPGSDEDWVVIARREFDGEIIFGSDLVQI